MAKNKESFDRLRNQASTLVEEKSFAKTVENVHAQGQPPRVTKLWRKQGDSSTGGSDPAIEKARRYLISRIWVRKDTGTAFCILYPLEIAKSHV